MVASTSLSIEQLPPEMVRAAIRDGECDADAVVAFLRGLGFSPTAEKPLALPIGLLFDLAAGLRFLKWEMNGIFIHTEAGLPNAHETLKETLLRFGKNEKPAPGAQYHSEMVRLSRRFSWEYHLILGKDIQLREADGDILVDAMARFLWARQKAKRTAITRDN